MPRIRTVEERREARALKANGVRPIPGVRQVNAPNFISFRLTDHDVDLLEFWMADQNLSSRTGALRHLLFSHVQPRWLKATGQSLSDLDGVMDMKQNLSFGGTWEGVRFRTLSGRPDGRHTAAVLERQHVADLATAQRVAEILNGHIPSTVAEAATRIPPNEIPLPLIEKKELSLQCELHQHSECPGLLKREASLQFVSRIVCNCECHQMATAVREQSQIH